MRSNVIVTYSHTDNQVRFLIRYTFITAFLAGIVVGGFIHAFVN